MVKFKILGVFFLVCISVSACRSRENGSGLDLVNALPVLNESLATKPVVQLFNDGRLTCTGTFLNSTTVLTATHCVTSKDEVTQDSHDSDIDLLSLSTGNKIIKVFRNEEYVKKLKAYNEEAKLILQAYGEQLFRKLNDKKKVEAQLEKDAKIILAQFWAEFVSIHDIALLHVEENKFSKGLEKYYKVGSERPKMEEVVYFIGFGSDRFTTEGDSLFDPNGNYGMKRHGISLFQSKPEDVEFITAGVFSEGQKTDETEIQKGVFVSPNMGDSGGPVISCGGRTQSTFSSIIDCETMTVLGVNAQLGTVFGNDPKLVVAYAADLSNSAAKEFFKTAINCKRQPCIKDFEGSGLK